MDGLQLKEQLDQKPFYTTCISVFLVKFSPSKKIWPLFLDNVDCFKRQCSSRSQNIFAQQARAGNSSLLFDCQRKRQIENIQIYSKYVNKTP